jgi:hypothetical protein
MKKIFYLVLTFFICYILKLSHIWIGFVPALLVLNLLKFEDSFMWEIPLAALCLGIAESAFPEELVTISKVFLPCSSVIIAYYLPKRLVIFFPAAMIAIFTGGIYGLCIMTASLWLAIRTIMKKASYKTVF